MPYVGHVRWSTLHEAAGLRPPWHVAAAERRTTLVSFVGSLNGGEEAHRLRQRIVDICRRNSSSCTCVTELVQPSPEPLRLRQRSVFCLEPPG